MHAYSTDLSERRFIPFYIAASAIGTVFVIFHFVDTYKIGIPWWASPPIDTMAFYGLFYWLFDNHIWRIKLLHQLHIIKTPDISGKWHGIIDPTPTNGVSGGLQRETDIAFSINQSWTTLLIVGQTNLSRSHSVSGNIIVSDERTISYDYVNEPSVAAPSTMHVHRGTTRLMLNEECTILTGEYYSGRDRQNIGSIRMTRVTS